MPERLGLMALALLLDRLWGEPQRAHPLVLFGQVAQRVEARLWRGGATAVAQRLRGLLAWSLLVLPIALLVFVLTQMAWLGWLLQALCLYGVIGLQSLQEHAQRVQNALEAADLPAARQALACLVSRDTGALDATAIAAATVESVLENGNDAVLASLFWFAWGGAPLAVLHRCANTLDAMWGYRNARYRHFGWAAARLDDALAWLPARCTALSYALQGHTSVALQCWRTQSPQWESPNAGPVMASGAAALGLQLGGAACYAGAWQQRPVLGQGRAAKAEDIARACRLVQRSAAGGVCLWAVLTVLVHALA